MMKAGKLILTSILLVSLLAAFPLRPANMQSSPTLSGHIKTKSAPKTSIPRFNVKLYPPKASKKPILLATTDSRGDFKFTGLTEKTYLLEIYLGKNLVYQEVIGLTASVCCEIDLTGAYARKQCPCPKA